MEYSDHHSMNRDQSRYRSSQWEVSLQCNNISDWLGAYLDWSLLVWDPHSQDMVLGTWYLYNRNDYTGKMHIYIETAPRFDVILWAMKSLRPSDAYMHQYNIPTLVQIMACHLFCAKSLSEPKLSCCQLDPKEYTSVNFFVKFKSFHSKKCTWKCHLRNSGHFAVMC